MKTMPQMLPRTIWELPLYGATWRMEGGQWSSTAELITWMPRRWYRATWEPDGLWSLIDKTLPND
jgi:hypothetical protein